MEKKLLKLRVNGEDYEVYAEPWHTLQEVLRNDLSLTGLKKGCDTGYCGACTVLLNGKAVKSCVVLARQAQDYEITTVEGLAKGFLFAVNPGNAFANYRIFFHLQYSLSIKALLRALRPPE